MSATKGAAKWKEKGNQEFSKGNMGKAIEFYTYATEMDPKNPVFYTNRATAYYKMKKFEKSLRDSNKAIGCDSKWAKGHYRAGLALLALGRAKEAVASLKVACDVDGGKSATFQRDYDKARASMMEGMSAADMLKQEGNEQFKVGDQENAIKSYTKALNVAKDDEAELKASILANRAACYRQLYNPDAVIRDCTAALELVPTYAKALIRRAQAYENLEKYEEALADFQQASVFAPNTPVAYQGSSRIRKALKRNAAAKNE